MMLAAVLSLALTRADGLRVVVSPSNTQPSLLVMLPGHSEPDVEILFPEHVTVRKHGASDVEHLYLFRPLTMPARYLASYTWPVPPKLVERRSDGITYYNKSRKVDEALIATLSTDRKWIFASFTRETGNVWSNPELTCQHVDPQAPLPPRGTAAMEVRLLIFRGSLDDLQSKVAARR